MDLEAIPGVGAKTAARLAELDNAEAAVADGDVTAIARAPGIDEARAARIARAAIRHRYDEEESFCETDRARELTDAALDLVRERAVTDAGRRRLETLYPSRAPDRIAEVRTRCERAIDRGADPAVVAALEGVEPLAPPGEVRVRERCLATSDADSYQRARELVPELSVELVQDVGELADLARGYATVVALDEAYAGVDLEGDVRVIPDALADPVAVVPERTLAFFANNRDRLRAAVAVHEAAGIDPPGDLADLDRALARLDADGSVAGDATLDRLSAAVDDLDAAVSAAERVANEQLRAAIRDRDVTIEGDDLLSLVERGAGVDSLLRRELVEEFEAAIEAARRHLVDALALEAHADLAERAFGGEPTFPVVADEAVVGRLRETLTAERDRRSAGQKQSLARTLAAYREPAETLVAAAIACDVDIAIARFAADFDCTLPEMGGTGIAIEGGRSPLLAVPFDAVEPVDYSVRGPTLLSGVNSGGKTSTLDLLAIVTILAHTGLPVPATAARVAYVDGLHYRAKSQGTLDAGALESTLLAFGELAEAAGTRLVLVDELEAITEPGASAIIVAGILETLSDRDTTAVFVSHLAEEIRAACTADVSVDGIEATGLVDGELRVCRSPRTDHLARSTPELIVEKLADDRGGFYERLLAKFD